MRKKFTNIFIVLVSLVFFQISVSTKEIKVEDGDKIEKVKTPTTDAERQLEKEHFFEKMKSILENRKKKGVMFQDTMGRYFTNGYYKFHLLPEVTSSKLAFIEYKIDNSTYLHYKDPIELKEEGTYKLAHKGVDVLGNVEKEEVYTIIVDKKAPDVVADIVGEFFIHDNVRYYKPGAKLDVKAFDDSSGLDFILVNTIHNDKGGNLPYDPANPVIFDKPGAYTIIIRAIDKVANLSKKKTLNFQVDGRKPVATHKIIPEPKLIDKDVFCKVESTVTLEAEDSESGVYKIEYSIDKAKWSEYKNSVTIGSDPLFKIYYRAVDNVGNVSSEKEYNCRVDAIAPKSKMNLMIKP